MRKLMLTIAITLIASSTGLAAEWGTITGSVVLDGDVPEPVLLHAKGAPIKDADVCAVEDVYRNDLVINPDTKGVANVFVYLRKKPKSIHPDGKTSTQQVLFDQKNCRFIPHVLVLQKGASVEVLNSDGKGHNIHTHFLSNANQNVLVPGSTGEGKGVVIELERRERFPVGVSCDIHPWMKAHWLVTDHPYGAATDAEGNFTIKNLPVGEHTFTFWHERCGYVEKSKKITVVAGDNKPLKPLKVELSKLEEK